MAIDINNLQYSIFVSFADNNGCDTIACLEKDTHIIAEGPTRNISVKKGDTANSLRYYLFGRSDDSAAVNNEVRNLFLNTVLEVCGAHDQSELPEDVRKALKLFDMNKGRPLTARRIGLVRDAINRVKANEEKNVAAAVNAEPAVNAPAGNNGGQVDPVDAYYRSYGPFVKDTVQATVDELGNQAALGDIEVLDAAEMTKLREGSKAIKNFCFDTRAAFDVDVFCEEMERFRKTVTDNLKKLYPNGTGSAAMTALRTNMFLHYSALNLSNPEKGQFNLAVSNHRLKMSEYPEHKRLMDLLFPLTDCIRYVEGKVEA